MAPGRPNKVIGFTEMMGIGQWNRLDPGTLCGWMIPKLLEIGLMVMLHISNMASSYCYMEVLH